MTRKRRKRKWRRRPSGGRTRNWRIGQSDESELLQNFVGPGRGTSFSTDVHSAGLRWPAAALPRGVLSVLQPGADDSAARGSCLRSLLRPVATSAAGRFGRRGRAAACTSLSPQSVPGFDQSLSGVRALRSHALQHGLPFAGISRRREALCGIRTGAAHSGPARGLTSEARASFPFFFFDFLVEFPDFLAHFVAVFRVRIQIQIALVRLDGLFLQALFFLSFRQEAKWDGIAGLR